MARPLANGRFEPSSTYRKLRNAESPAKNLSVYIPQPPPLFRQPAGDFAVKRHEAPNYFVRFHSKAKASLKSFSGSQIDELGWHLRNSPSISFISAWGTLPEAVRSITKRNRLARYP